MLPFFSPIPIGGYAIVYEYANGLQSRGHQVTVVHPQPGQPQSGLRSLARSTKWRWTHRRLGRRAVDWFPLHPGVRLTFVPQLSERSIPPGDAVVATAWRTAPAVSRADASRGMKLYLLQHHETWDGSPDEVDATWRLPLTKIATGSWLLELAAQMGQADDTVYIPNGVEVDRYQLTTPIEQRQPHRVAMLFNPTPWKGAKDGVEALSLARRDVPDLEAVVFGTFPRPDWFPDWVTYVENPHGADLVGIYNSCSIFLHPSWAEGCPLPPSEAMACGCALVAAANPGVCDYARDGHNSLLAPVKAPSLLSDALSRALSDQPLRRAIALQGHLDMQSRSWSRCIDKFEALVRQPVVSAAPTRAF